MNVKQKSSWLKHWDFLLADLISINLIFYLAYFLRTNQLNMYENKEYRMMVIVAVLLHFCITFFADTYSNVLRRGYFKEFSGVLVYNMELFGFLILFMFVTQSGQTYSRIITLSSFFMNVILTYMIHILIKYYHQNIDDSNKNFPQYIIISDEDYIEDAVEKIKDGPQKSFKIAGIALENKSDDSRFKNDEYMGIPIVAYGDEIYEYCCHHVVDEVFICIPLEHKEKVQRLCSKFMEMGIPINIKVNMYFKDLPNARFGRLNSAEFVSSCMNVASSRDLFLKRVMDIAAGIVGCLITAVLYIFIAPAIKIADPKGPVFFKQQRAGKNGRVFNIYKFRSMYSDAEERKAELMKDNKMEGLMFKLDADPRIIGSGPDGTKKGLGYWLRTLSLDEFPNFWSILKGDMSLVGTRPPTLDEYEKYELHHKSRLAAKPGLTGMWQVSGRSNMTDFEEIVKLDNEYLQNWNIGQDIKIVLKTIVVVLTRRGSQ